VSILFAATCAVSNKLISQETEFRQTTVRISSTSAFLCRVTSLTLGKRFAECSTFDTRQSVLCRPSLCRVQFAECGTRQSVCRVFLALCRVSQALSKPLESSSDVGLVFSGTSEPAGFIRTSWVEAGGACGLSVYYFLVVELFVLRTANRHMLILEYLSWVSSKISWKLVI
jgi:hypothetical protein